MHTAYLAQVGEVLELIATHATVADARAQVARQAVRHAVRGNLRANHRGGRTGARQGRDSPRHSRVTWTGVIV